MSNPGFAPTGFNLGSGSAGGAVQPKPDHMSPYDPLITQAAQQYNLDPVMLRRQFVKESAGNPNAVSNKGATGLSQLMGPTAMDLGVTDPNDPQQSIFGGAKYMRILLDRYKQDYTPALAAYNWGMGNLDRQGIENAPNETVDYVNHVRGGQFLTRRQQAMAMAQPAAPANDPYPSYTDAMGNVVTRAAPPPDQPALAPTGFNLNAPDAQPEAPPLAPTGFNLNAPEPAQPFNARQPLNAVPQLPVTPPAWGQQPQPAIDPGATAMPPLTAPPNLAAAAPQAAPAPPPAPTFTPQAYGADIAQREQQAQRDAMKPGPLIDPTKPEATWGQTYADTMAQVAPSMEKAGGGVLRFLGENLPAPTAGPGATLSGEQLQQRAQLSGQMAKSAGTPGTFANVGKHISDEAEKAILAHTPNVPRGGAKYYANKVGAGIAETLPALLGTAALGGDPAPLIAQTAATTFGNSYADEMKKPGATPHAAAVKASALATVDAAATAIGVKAFGITPFKGVSGTITNDMTGQVAQYTRQSVSNTIKNLVVQGLAIQPAISLVNHGVDNVINGRPVTEGMGEAYVTGAISNTLVSGLAHLASGKAGLTQVGKFEKPMGQAYEFNPEGLTTPTAKPGFKFKGPEIGSYYAGEKQNQDQGQLRLPAPAQAEQKAETIPATTTGEQTHGPVQAAANAPGNAEAPVSGEVIPANAGAGGPPDIARQSGDQTGNIGTGGTSGVPLPAEGTEAVGNGPDAVAAQPAAAPVEQVKTGPITVADRTVLPDGSVRTIYANANGHDVGYSIHQPGNTAPDKIHVANEMWRDDITAKINQHLADNEGITPAAQQKAAFTQPQIEPAPAAAVPGQGTIVPSKSSASDDAKSAAKGAFDAGNTTPVQLKSGETIRLAHVDTDKDVGSRAITAFDKDGNRIGLLLYETEAMPDGTRINPSVHVDEAWQRKGVATAMYDLAEQHGGLIPDVDQHGQVRSPEGQAFRQARAGVAGTTAAAPPQEEPATAENVRAEITQLQKAGTITAEEATQLGGMLKVMSPAEVRSTMRGTLAARQGGGNYEQSRATAAPSTLAEQAQPAPKTKTEPVNAAGQGPGEAFDLPDVEEHPEAPPEDESVLSPEEREALTPADRAALDLLDKQIERRTAAQDAAPTPEGQVQLKRQIEYRDALVAKAKIKIPRPRPKVDLSPPEREGKPKEFLDYKFGTGTPVFRDAFVEHALQNEKNEQGQPMSMDEALEFADRAIQFHGARQVEILRGQVKSKFGFKDVKIDKSLDTKTARDMLLDFHRAAQDMMHALGLPVDMASFLGKNTLELKPASKKQYGSYDPSDKTITLNDRASVYGHEWTHALDHDISDTIFHVPNPQPLATYLGVAGQLNPADHMSVRMGHLLNTLFYDQADLALEMMKLHTKGQAVTKAGQPTVAALKAQADLAALQTGARVKKMKITLSEYYKSSALMGDKYWTTPWELMARAGEAYIAHTMTLQGLDPRGVVMPDEAYLSDNDERLRNTFPKDTDRANIIQAFDHLMDGYRQEALAGSVAAAQALRGGTSDPSIYSRLSRDKKRVGAFRTLINRIRNLNDTLQQSALTDPLRPDPGLYNAWHRAQVWGSSTFNSRMGFLESALADPQTPDAAKPFLQSLMDRLGRTHGTGRHTGWSTIEERQNSLLNKRMYQLTNILLNNGFDTDSITKEQSDHIHHAMTTGENTYPVVALEPNGARVPISREAIKAARELRGVHDEIYHDIDNAGLEIGYAESAHYPRLYDQVRAHKEPEGFLKHAAALHKEMFDEEIGAPGDHPDKLADIWTRLPKERKNSAPPDVQDGLKALKKNLSRQQKLKGMVDDGTATQADQDELDQLEQDAQQLAADNHDGLGNHIAKMNADIWLLNLRKQRALDYDQTGPGGDFLNKRELPPQADRIMRDYMITDVVTALARYYEATSRRIAAAERFGPNGEKLDALYDGMLKGGMEPDDLRLVQWVTNSMIGKTDNNTKLGIAKAADYAHSTAAVGLMGRSAYITLPEPFTLALSHRSMRAGLVSLSAAFGEVMRTASAKERTELAEFLGVTRSAAHNEIIMNRVGHDYSDSPNVGKFMSLYYIANMITGLTNLNSRANMAGGHYLLTKWSRDLLSTRSGMNADDERDRAQRKFNEYGVNPQDHDAFAKEILSLDGLPNKDTVEKMQFVHTYSLAMYRLVKSGTLDPPKMSRPMLADEKWPGLALQFLNYAYEYQRVVLDPAIRDFEYSTKRRYQQHRKKGHGKFRSGAGAGWKASEIIGKYAMLGAAMVALQLPATMWQQWMFNHDEWEKHEKDDTLAEWLQALAISRSSFGGTMDAPFQAVTSLKYDADPSSLTNGAALRWIDKNIYNLTQWGAGPSARESGSNVRAHEGVKSLYNLIGIPLEAALAVKLVRFGPLGVAAAAGLLAYGTSQQAATHFADMWTGPKGAEPPQPHHGLPRARHLPHPEKQAPAKDAKSSVPGASVGLLGIADDIAVPAWKLLAPVVGAVPSKLRWALALGGLGYEIRDFIKEMEPFRNAPPPKKK